MVSLSRGYAHVPLALVSVLLMVFLIAGLLGRRVDGVWDSALRIGTPVGTPVAITPARAAPPRVLELAPAPEPSASPVAIAVPSLPVRVELPAAAAPSNRYVLESGPFLTAEVADRVEDQLNQLGYATVRFRTQKVRRLYRVVLTGFASAAEARRAVAHVGRGTVVTGDEGPAVLVERYFSLREAVAAGRALRARNLQVRVDQDLGPAVIYHVRYGQFGTETAAEARSEELAALGLASQVVKVR